MNEELTKQNSSLSLVERLKARKVALSNKVLLLDVSSSMSISIEPGKSRIDALREIVQSIAGKPVTIVFSTDARIASKDSIPDPDGCTYMSKAFNLAKDQGFKEALLITDGEASDKDEALNAVENLKVQIMYVGGVERPTFLDELASKAGSFATTEDLKCTKAIAEKVRLLLGSGEETETKKGPICL